MKKFFFIVFVLSGFLIAFYHNKLDLNLYHLLYIKHADVFKRLQDSFSNEVIFLSESKDLSRQLSQINAKIPVFTSFEGGLNPKFLEDFKALRLPTFGGYQQLKEDPQEFFAQSASLLFSQFSPKILPISQDFFSLSSWSNLLKQHSRVSLDFSENLMVVRDGEKRYVLVVGKLKPYYRPSDLLLFAKEAEKIAMMSGPALFSAYGQERGNQEGVWLSGIALGLSVLFLLFAFRNVKILSLVLVVLFALVFGLGMSFWILDEVHILSLVMSISLIGIILDFALHFICYQEGQKIKPNSIKAMRKVFLLGFGISLGGYLLFLFSPLDFLHQVALISAFSLLGALVFSYFCLPLLLQGESFESSRGFERVLAWIWKAILKVRSYRLVVYAILMGVVIYGGIEQLGKDQKENIKNYSSAPKTLLEQSLQIKEKIGMIAPTQILILNHCSFACERFLIQKLREKGLIGYARGLAEVFLDEAEQRDVLTFFREASSQKTILELYAQLGIPDVQTHFKAVQKLKPQGLKESLKFPLVQSYAPLYVDDSRRLVLIDRSKMQEGTKEERELMAILGEVAKQYKARIDYFDLTQEINQGFEELKWNALWLKLFGLLFAFVCLGLFYGWREASKMIIMIVFSMFLVVGIFGLLGLELNIFAIFGLILASAMGIDYLIFARSESSQILRLKSIFCAMSTSFISFVVLVLSSTYAVAVFGLSAALGLLCVAFFSNLEFNQDESH